MAAPPMKEEPDITETDGPQGGSEDCCHRGGRDLRRTGSAYAVSKETFESLASLQKGAGATLGWNCLFVLPAWLQAWWSTLGAPGSPYLLSVSDRDGVVGIAPLLVHGDQARLMGDPDICDYVDFVVARGRGGEFCRILLEHLRGEGIASLDADPVRGDSTVMTHLIRVAKELDYEVSAHPEEVSLEVELPATWNAFLGALSGKERHEVRRKLRRLEEAGPVSYRVVAARNEVGRNMEIFLTLFARNGGDKAAFMTGRMASFFRALAGALAEQGILRLFFLDLEAIPAATVMCFDYNKKVYLYNNAYDDRFRALSVGLLSKVFSIRDSIERGRRTYDFLKGGEAYKYRLGGTPIHLYRCLVTLG